MGPRLGALKLSHGCGSGLRESVVVISGVAVHRRAESGRETLPQSELLFFKSGRKTYRLHPENRAGEFITSLPAFFLALF